jgi:predicted DNA repair protein MutK
MAAANLLTLIDDIATVLDDVAILTKVAGRKTVAAIDDVAVLTKVATKKTAGVLGDDLALNAQQVAGVRAERELPVVWAVAKGSFVNKAILVPAALAISAFAPWAVTPLLMLGGVFLCYEGFEKLAHRFLHARDEDDAQHAELRRALVDPEVDLMTLEKDKIKGAIRTDLILSAEIIAITLGTVATAPFATRVAVLCAIALLMTVGVYGLVAGIVKLDDGGLYLSRRAGDGAWRRWQRGLGDTILKAAPYLMKGLSVAGTAAMFLVGGGILSHGLPALHHAVEALTSLAGNLAMVGAVLAALMPLLLDALIGIVAGGLALLVVSLMQRSLRASRSAA